MKNRCLFPKMDYRYILIIVYVWTSVSSSFGSQVITTSFGKTATLQCPIANQGSDLQSLYWGKEGKTIYSQTSNGRHTSGKYLVTDTSSLVIPDVTESDTGNYSCIVAFRKSSGTIQSDIMQLYVIDVYVSHCKDTGQPKEVDGCSCTINGSKIKYLGCSASGFPHPPVVSWEEEDIIVCRSSSVDLTKFSENITLTCKARDVNLKGAVANKTVCVYYVHEATSTSGPLVETTTAYVNDRARLAAIVVSIFLILVLLPLLILSVAAVYLLKTGKVFRSPYTLKRTSTSKATSVGDLPTLQPESASAKDEFDDVNCNQDVPETLEESYKQPLDGMNVRVNDLGCVDMKKDSWKISKGSDVGDLPTSQQLPLVGQVLLDDLSSAPEETRESIKAAVVALVEKRVKPYTIYQSHGDPYASFMNATLQRSRETLDNPDAAFVYMVLEDLDKIHQELDRDECEILITKPDFQEVTDESKIPDYQGNTVINQSLPMPGNMTSSMNSSMVACNPLPTVLREKLEKELSERAAIRNAISQIILDCMKTGHSGLKVNNYLNCSTAMLPCTNTSSYAQEIADDEVSRLVALWTSKTVKLDNDVNNRIKKYLFPLKPKNIKKSSDSDPVVQTRQEEDEIPDTPSTAKLLEDKSGDGAQSNNHQSSTRGRRSRRGRSVPHSTVSEHPPWKN